MFDVHFLQHLFELGFDDRFAEFVQFKRIDDILLYVEIFQKLIILENDP